MTDGQYRALVAWLGFWKHWPQYSIEQAMADIGIKCSKESAIEQLYKAGHNWDDASKTLTWVM